jgi:tRNA-Thr(GGU) m(6)t(6)A37 methyltransferase TsaA
MKVIYRPIGIIHSPYQQVGGMPIQPSGALGVRGQVEIYAEFAEGLKDLEGFSHLFLIYHFHQAGPAQMLVTPFLDSQPRGVFATRAPLRPNPIGLSVVRLLGVQGNLLEIENVDILDGTPLLDIKPCVPDFDHPAVERVGWLADANETVHRKRSDDRFR